MVITLSDLIKLYELGVSLKDKRPTKPEKDLLLKAEENKGEILVLESDQSGEFIRVGRVLADDQDPSIRVIYLEALEKLIKRGLVRHENKGLFCLTSAGFQKARKLKSRI